MGHHQEVHQHTAHDKAPAHPDQLHQAEHQATQALQSCVNEARVLSGTVTGAMKSGAEAWQKNPLGVTGEAALSAAIGVGAAFAAPEVLLGAAIIGGGYIAYDQLVNKAGRNEQVMHAMMDAAKPGQSEAHIEKDRQIIEKALGNDIFHAALTTASGAAGGIGGLAFKEMAAANAKAAMNAALEAGLRNNHATPEMQQRFLNGDTHALDQGRLSGTIKTQQPLKFEPNNRPPETPQGLGHITMVGNGH